MIHIIYSTGGTITELVQSNSEEYLVADGVSCLTLNTTLAELPSDISYNYYVDPVTVSLQPRTLYTGNLKVSRNILEYSNTSWSSAVLNLPSDGCELSINNKLYQIESGTSGFILPIDLVLTKEDIAISLSGKYKSDTLIVKVYILEQARTALLEDMKAYKKELEAKGCVTPLGVVSMDDRSLPRIQLSAQRASLSDDSFSINWTMYDGSVVTHTKQQMIDMSIIVAQYLDDLQQKKKQLEAEISNAKNMYELERVIIDKNWPGQPVEDIGTIPPFLIPPTP